MPTTQPPEPEPDEITPGGPARVDPESGLPLPDPFPDYIRCPNCGEAEVEVWCYQDEARCHACGAVFAHTPPPWCGKFPFCKRGKPAE
jgi:hypothetical protein